MLNIAVVGIGNWGQNVVRTFSRVKNARLSCICDTNKAILSKEHKNYPSAKATIDFNDILKDKTIDAVAIATGSETHYRLAKKSLEAGKHTFVEKPLTLKINDAKKLIDLAKDMNCTLMVGHLLKYHPAVLFLKKLIDRGKLGDIYLLYSQRLNLGKVKRYENVWWSLAPHDISLVLYLLGEDIDTISARGECYIQKGTEDIVFANLCFKDKKMAQIHVSWLDPNKVRRLTIVGSKKMVVFDDMEAVEKIKMFDKGALKDKDYLSYEENIALRFGDIHIPKVGMVEPLLEECQHFVDSILKGSKPRSDGEDGLRVVEILNRGMQSLKMNGKPIKIKNSK